MDAVVTVDEVRTFDKLKPFEDRAADDVKDGEE
jgi:hypothetical protein